MKIRLLPNTVAILLYLIAYASPVFRVLCLAARLRVYLISFPHFSHLPSPPRYLYTSHTLVTWHLPVTHLGFWQWHFLLSTLVASAFSALIKYQSNLSRFSFQRQRSALVVEPMSHDCSRAFTSVNFGDHVLLIILYAAGEKEYAWSYCGF